MSKEQAQKRKEKAEQPPVMIVKIGDGYRVHSARNPSQFYYVNWQDQYPVCNCPDFEKHKNEPMAECKHIIAVLEFREQSQDGAAPASSHGNGPLPAPSEPAGGTAVDEDRERAAIQTEGNRASNAARPERNAPRKPAVNAESRQPHMLVRRSMSPDGHIDSVSVEIDFPIVDISADEIKTKATKALRLQNDIARDFLGSRQPGKPKSAATKPKPKAQDNPVPARMASIGMMMGKFGPRYFINFEVNGTTTKHFGSQKQLVACISEAGYSFSQEEVSNGVELDIPCRVITKPSSDGRYLNIERVLPANQN